MRAVTFFATVAISAFAAVGITQAVDLTIPGATAGDWLSFSGSLAGVILAVAGAITVEQIKTKIANINDLKRLKRAIEKFDTSRTYDAAMHLGAPEDPLSQLIWREMELERAMGSVLYAMDRAMIDDIELWEQVNTLRRGLNFVQLHIKPVRELLAKGEVPPDLVASQNQLWNNILATFDEMLPLVIASLRKHT